MPARKERACGQHVRNDMPTRDDPASSLREVGGVGGNRGTLDSDMGSKAWEETERYIEKTTRTSHPEIVKILQDLLDAHKYAFEIVGGRKREQVWENVVDLFAARAYQTATVAMDLSLKGYYGEAGILARVLTEQGLFIKYYSSYAERAEEYWNGWDYELILHLTIQLIGALGAAVDPLTRNLLLKFAQQVGAKLDPSAIVTWHQIKKRIKNQQEPSAEKLKSQVDEQIRKGKTPGFKDLVNKVQYETAREIYETMSHFVHSRYIPGLMATLLSEEPSGALTLVLGPKYDEDTFMIVAQPVYSAECNVLQQWTRAIPLLFENEQWTDHLSGLVRRVLELQEQAEGEQANR